MRAERTQPTPPAAPDGSRWRVSAILALVATVQLLAQIGFQVIVLAAAGVGPTTDAFVAAQAVPMVLVAVLALSLQSVWQPRFATSSVSGGKWRQAHRSAQAQALIIFGISGAALAATASLWAKVIFIGLAAEALQLVLEMTPLLLLASVFQGSAAVMTAAQRGRDRLLSAEVAALAGAVIAAALAWPVVRAWGIVAAAYLALGRAILVWILLEALLGGSTPAWRDGWRDRRAWAQLRPLLAGSSIFKLAPLVDRFWSSMGPPGSVALFGLAHAAMAALAGLLERSLCMPVTPRLARSATAGDADTTRRLYRRSVAMTAVATAAIGVGLLLVQPWWGTLAGLVFRVPEQTAEGLWWICLCLLGFLFVAASGTAIVSVYYALGDTLTPAKIGLVGFLLGVIAKSAGFWLAGLQGLALATSLYYLGNLAALAAGAERRLRAMSGARCLP